MNIICVKIAQRILPITKTHRFNYFPFDRGYLVPPEATEYLPRLFRAYMVMDLTPTLHAALNDLSFTQVYHDTVRRNPLPPQPGKPHQILKGLCNDPADWKFIVPTFLWNEYDAKNNKYIHATIGYILSHAVRVGHNAEAELPRITFVTPHQTYPLMCVACLQLPEQLEGKCTIGTANCRKNCSFKLPVDPLQTTPEKEEENNDRLQ